MQELNWIYKYEDVGSDENQYTYEECHRIGPVDAKYVRSANEDFVGNPFIEALPRPREEGCLVNAYMVPIPEVDVQKLATMTINEQKETVLSLKRLRLPLAFQRQLEFIDYDVIVSSYMLRKSYIWEDKEFLGRKTRGSMIRMKGKIEDSAPSGFALLGFSGCGKSSSLKQLFENIPQVIMHHPSVGETLPQITYLVVSCMPNSNFATLYRQIGEAIDNALGNPEPEYELMITRKCRSLADKQLKVCQLIEMFSIGTIVLDEIQLINFNSNKENSYEGLLGIVNKTKVALSVVGTDEAYQKLFAKLRNARRTGDLIDASAYTSDREYFNYLVKLLLIWQWVDTPIEWSKELADTLYECTGGIINQLIWLYKWIMIEYLDSKSKGKTETIDKKFIHRINDKHFKQLKNSIDFVNQSKLEEEADREIMANAALDKNEYEMPKVNIGNLAYESKVTKQVLNMIRPLHPEYSSDDITRAVKEILSEEGSRQRRVDELARGTLDVLMGNPRPKKKKAVPKSKPLSKNICDYISLDNT